MGLKTVGGGLFPEARSFSTFLLLGRGVTRYHFWICSSFLSNDGGVDKHLLNRAAFLLDVEKMRAAKKCATVGGGGNVKKKELGYYAPPRFFFLGAGRQKTRVVSKTTLLRTFSLPILGRGAKEGLGGGEASNLQGCWLVSFPQQQQHALPPYADRNRRLSKSNLQRSRLSRLGVAA